MFARLRNFVGTVVCGVTLFTAVGCGCGPTRHPVNVSMSPQFGNNKPAIEVVITALNHQEADYLAQYPMSRFFAPGDTERGGLDKIVMEFGPNSQGTQSFTPASKDDWERHWRVWEGRQATQLFVMAFLPGRFEDKPGNLDARRQAVPLGKCKWEKDDSPINFELTPAKLELLTPPKQGK
jgi:hypothetical protein